LAQAASILIGRGGAALVSIAIMLATYGYISANLLNDSRLVYSLAAQDDFPAIFARFSRDFTRQVWQLLFMRSPDWYWP
jgi:amino acid transporter